MSRRRNSTMWNWLKMGGLVIGGVVFHKTIAETLSKIPVIGEMINNNKEQ